MSNLPRLHLGCGRRFHPDWHNLDFSPMVEGVIVHDLTKPLPYADNSVECCHTAHVLGHFRKEQADAFLAEQLRVLKPGGVARFSAPDLQQVVQEYRELIGPLCEGDYTREHDYDWILIELHDQVARQFYGGKMAKFLAQDPVPNRDYVLSRIGEEGGELMDKPHVGDIVQTKLKASHLGYYLKKARLKFTRGVVRVMGGKEAAKAFHEGCFRRFSGEVQWCVYDQYSLTRQLSKVGFVDMKRHQYNESSIPEFASYSFDGNEKDIERKPESFYLEATKPL